MSWRDWLSASPTYDGRYLIDLTSSRDGKSLTVVDTQDGTVAAEHVVREFDEGWRTDRAWLLAPWLLVTDANTATGSADAVRVYRYDLRSGDVVDLRELAGFPEPWLVYDASDGVAVFDTRLPEQLTSCLWTVDIPSLTWSKRWCGPRDWIISWPWIGPSLTVTFRMQEGPHDGLEPCVRLFRLSLVDNLEPSELPLQRPCTAFSGAGGNDWTAWSEVGLHSEEIEYSPGFAQLPNSQVVGLGIVETGSINACGDWVYWQSYAPHPQRETLLRWRPGQAAEVLFEAESGHLLGSQECAPGWITISDAIPGDVERVLAANAGE